MEKKKSLGFLECAGYGAALYAMDKACKAAEIHILGIDTINPKDSRAPIPLTIQVKFEGRVADVQVAAQVAREAALRFNSEHEVQSAVVENPYEGTRILGSITKIKLGSE